MAERLDCVVVGAGVVGLAVGRALSLAGREVVVLEAEAQIGMHTSSRNSGVIHAGIYYPEDSFKARLCIEGREMLYRYCEEHGVAHRRLGKLIVATDRSDVEQLHAIWQQARCNGVNDLSLLETTDVEKLEPAVKSCGALYSPSTGIVDSHELMLALQAEIESTGGAVVLDSEVGGLDISHGRLEFECGGGTFVCQTLVNSAGLRAQALVAGAGRVLQNLPNRHLAKGHYYTYPGKSPFTHLVYPLPMPGGLGIHATNDLAGNVRFGPDVSWVDEIDYAFDDSHRQRFVDSIRRYFPSLDEDRLVPGFAGIRPKIVGPGEPPADFAIQGKTAHGIDGLVNLFGIESPGLTACLAIGEYVQFLVE